MCGIVGRLNFNTEPVQAQTLKAMSDRLAHRGPDDAGMFVDGNVGLGFRRLAIIDLSVRGHQPMSDEAREVHLVFNGEIYNFRSLRAELEADGVRFLSETDSEVIIHLYKKYGVGCLERLRGMFAFAIWDARARELFIARDRLGKKPLKFYLDAHRFIFASELKALFVNPEIPKEIDWAAVDEYLSYQFVPHPKTGFLGIEKLEPAHYLIVKENGEVRKKRYWQLDFSKKEQHTPQEWKEKITESLKESVRLRMVSDVPLGAHLSGGVDSSLVVALMAQASSRPVKTFSIGFREDSHNELPQARLVAERYGTDHHEFVVESDAVDLLPKIARHFEEPFADSSALPTWILCELTRQHVTVALNGDGGDENFAGYARYKAMQRYETLRRFGAVVGPASGPLASVLRHASRLTKQKRLEYLATILSAYTGVRGRFYLHSFGFFREDEKEALYTPEARQRVLASRASSVMQRLFEESSGLSPTEQMLFVDFESYLPDDLLVKTDMASMAHALEVRSPLLDQVFVSQVASMPVAMKLAGRESKILLKEIAKALVPLEILEKPKRGFNVPCDIWLRTTLKTFVREHILAPSFLRFGFSRSAIEDLLTRHERGEDVSRKLWSLLMLRLWLQEWFERTDSSL
ncbi:asparagine synthase (glutamine-hydrolyzing) [Candidatus Uhrbacteria bacterium]|nr:asparagine synthase (glutamine-hydrolyzing) [Candidatus Uhrbacteria bacterium]